MADELPILIASLADDEARELEEAAKKGADRVVPLKWAPAQAGPHLLEIYTPDSNVPIRLRVEPLASAGGAETAEGAMALRLLPLESLAPVRSAVVVTAATMPPSESSVLEGAAAYLLSGAEDARAAAVETLLVAGPAGARALYEARVDVAPAQAARIAFVTTMKMLGLPAIGVIVSVLAQLEPHAGEASFTDLVEDVLLGTPGVIHERLGEVIVAYATSPSARLCRAAARALPRVWSDRATPTLRQLLWHDHDDVRIAALLGLHELGRVDAAVVATLAALADGGFAQGEPLRNAMRAALAASTAPEAAALGARL